MTPGCSFFYASKSAGDLTQLFRVVKRKRTTKLNDKHELDTGAQHSREALKTTW
jgi:hypothetical protein